MKTFAAVNMLFLALSAFGVIAGLTTDNTFAVITGCVGLFAAAVALFCIDQITNTNRG